MPSLLRAATNPTIATITTMALLALAAPAARGAKLTPAEVEQKLAGIPVFVVTDAEGSPLVANSAYGVFLDRSEAQAFLDALEKGKPDLAKQAQVRAIPLAEIVKMAKPGAELQPDFIAAKADRDAAAALGPKDEKPGMAPLFVVRAGSAYLTVTVEGRSIIPVFFTKAQADEVVEKYGKQAGGSEPARIEVAALEVILGALLDADDPDVARISLVPSPAMMAAVADPPPAAPGSRK